MRTILRLTAIAAALASGSLGFSPEAAAAGQLHCYELIDARAGGSGGTTFCWLSGRVCYDCYEDGSYASCSSDWQPCDPRPFMPAQQHTRMSPSGGAGAGSTAAAVKICQTVTAASLLRAENLY